MQKNTKSNDHWATPKSLIDSLGEISCFDPCPFGNDINLFDGLKTTWKSVLPIFVNPPYSVKGKADFVHKGISEIMSGNCSELIYLLPVSTGTVLFQEVILQYAAEVKFVPGRLKFEGVDGKGNHVNPGEAGKKLNIPIGLPKIKQSGQFDSMLVYFDCGSVRGK